MYLSVDFIEGTVDVSLTEGGIPKWMVEEGEFVDGYVNGDASMSSHGFSVSPGTIPNTKGILLWDEPLIIHNRNGREMCLLIMDTQGLWDYDTPNEFNVCIFGLSSILSSFLIFNSKGFFNTEQLKTFSNLSEFSKGVASQMKSFQQLDFLIRDFTDYNTDTDDRKKASVYNAEQLNRLRLKPQTKKEVERIESCFEQFDLLCLPRPGDIDVTNYNGSIKKISPLFMCILSDYIVHIMESVHPRRINGEELTVEAFAQFVHNHYITTRFAIECSNLFSNQDTFPDSSSVLDAMYSSINMSVMKTALEVGKNGGLRSSNSIPL